MKNLLNKVKSFVEMVKKWWTSPILVKTPVEATKPVQATPIPTAPVEPIVGSPDKPNGDVLIPNPPRKPDFSPMPAYVTPFLDTPGVWVSLPEGQSSLFVMSNVKAGQEIILQLGNVYHPTHYLVLGPMGQVVYDNLVTLGQDARFKATVDGDYTVNANVRGGDKAGFLTHWRR